MRRHGAQSGASELVRAEMAGGGSVSFSRADKEPVGDRTAEVPGTKGVERAIQGRSAGSARTQRRILRVARGLLIATGGLFVLIALIVYPFQGSQIEVTAQILTQTCHTNFNFATHQHEVRCDLDVRFRTRSGEVVTTTVGGALLSEINSRDGHTTIQLRYDPSDPKSPYKQSNYMPIGAFLGLLVGGIAVIAYSIWAFRRALARIDGREASGERGP